MHNDRDYDLTSLDRDRSAIFSAGVRCGIECERIHARHRDSRLWLLTLALVLLAMAAGVLVGAAIERCFSGLPAV